MTRVEVPAVAVRPRNAHVQTLLPVVTIVVTGLILFTATGRDDAYITFWAAQALARFGQIVNYNGQFIEQSSSLAHVVFLAAASRLMPMPVAVLGILFSLACGCVAVYVTGLLAKEVAPGAAGPARWLAATASGLVYWSLGGLETSLATATYGGLALVASRALTVQWEGPGYLGAVVASALVATVRPEGALIAVAMLAGLWVWTLFFQPPAGERRRVGQLLFLTGSLLVIAAALLAWRAWYTGQLVPQPVVAKAGGLSINKLWNGARYLGTGGLRIDGLVWLTGGVSAVYWLAMAARRRRVTPVLMVSSLMLVAGYGFIALNGGDWMEGHRFLVPLLPAAIALVVRVLASPGVPGRALAVVLTLQVAGVFWLARSQSSGSPIWTAAQPAAAGLSWPERRQRVNYRDAVFSARLGDAVRELHRSGRVRPVVMSVQMGQVSSRLASTEYGRVRFIDLVSLVTADFSRCQVTNGLTRGQLGLEVEYEFFFRHRDELARECGIPEPDIIFDVDKPDWRLARLVAANGYNVVYRQHGPIPNGSRLLPGLRVSGEQFLAVRHDLDVQPRGDWRFDRSR